MTNKDLKFRGYLNLGNKKTSVYIYIKGLHTRKIENNKNFIACVIPIKNMLIIFPEFNQLSKESKRFVLFHEVAHLKGIMDEFKAMNMQ